MSRSPNGGDADLPQVYSVVEAALTSAGFPFRVAMFPNRLPELGDVVEVHAFDVPEAKLLEVSREMNTLLAALRLCPMAVGMALCEAESVPAASRVPADAVWAIP